MWHSTLEQCRLLARVGLSEACPNSVETCEPLPKAREQDLQQQIDVLLEAAVGQRSRRQHCHTRPHIKPCIATQ